MDGTQTLMLILVLSNIIDAAKVSNCTNGVITLTCPTTSGCVLKIGDATFGHSKTHSKNCTMEVNDCQSNASFVWGLCEGRSQCNINVPQERPRNKCNNVSSYLTVEFECVCVRCRPLPVVPANLGMVSYSSPYLTANTTAIYTCRDGYLLAGPRVRTCLPDGTWTGLQPACSVPVTVCPPSDYQRSAYGARCYEFVSSVATWERAQADCSGRNGSLLMPGGSTELAFLGWQLDKMQVYNYVWLADAATGGDILTIGNITKLEGDSAITTCLELYKPEAEGATWQRRNATCTYMNAYLCVFEIEPSWIESIASTRNNFKSTKAGIGIGIGVGIILILVGLFCILCRDRKDEGEGLPEKTNPVPDQDLTHPDSEMDIYDDTTYDDTLPECDVTPSPSPDIEKYAQVDRRKKTNGHHLSPHPPSGTQPQQPNYDQVYASMSGMEARRPPTHHRHGSSNTYENVTVHNLVGSLKKKLTRPWRSTGSRRVTPEPPPPSMAGTVPRVMAPQDGANGDTAPGGNKSPLVVVVRRDKPQPAPKPAVRKSALEAKLEAIRAGRAATDRAAGRGVNGVVRTPSPEWEPSSVAASSTGVRREGAAGRSSRMDGPSSPQNAGHSIMSGIEIVENEIYDSDDNQGKLTEL